MKKIGSTILNLLIIICLIASSYAIFGMYDLKNTSQNKAMKNLISKTDKTIAEENNSSIEEDSNNLLNQYKDYYQNDDIVGILKIADTNITTFLVQTDNNTYYLSHNFTKAKDHRGAIFVDYRTPLNSKQVNIYGHNSRTIPIIFKELENYVNKDFYDTHKYISIWDGRKENIYEIASINIDKNSYEHIIINPINKKDHITKLSKSLYDTGVDINESDDLLIIQTCFYNPKNSYLIIVSKKIREV